MSSMKENTGEAVLEYMKEKIVSGEWSEGTKITKEVQLAEELGVSRTSVRAAMDRLVAMGVLVRKKRMGTFVKETSPQLLLNNLVPELMLNTYDELEILDFREILKQNVPFDLQKDIRRKIFKTGIMYRGDGETCGLR